MRKRRCCGWRLFRARLHYRNWWRFSNGCGVHGLCGEHPEADFMDMKARFGGYESSYIHSGAMGEKAYFIAVPTSSGTGSEATPICRYYRPQRYPILSIRLQIMSSIGGYCRCRYDDESAKKD